MATEYSSSTLSLLFEQNYLHNSRFLLRKVAMATFCRKKTPLALANYSSQNLEKGSK